MAEEEKSVFDEAEVSEELPEEYEDSPDEVENEENTKEFTPTISKESPKEALERKGVKKNMDGKVVTIKEIGFTKPKMKAMDGSPIAPKPCLADPAKKFYPGKLKIRFEEENLVEYYPNFKYFVNDDGEVNMQAKINRGGKNAIAMIFKLAVAKMGKPEDEVSDQEFYDFLVGKKVKLKVDSGEYNKKSWFRNDIVEFVD